MGSRRRTCDQSCPNMGGGLMLRGHLKADDNSSCGVPRSNVSQLLKHKLQGTFFTLAALKQVCKK